MDLVVMNKEEWGQRFAEHARKIVFSEAGARALERPDFGMLVIQDGQPVAYATFKEPDAKSLHLSYGGVFPDWRGKKIASRAFAVGFKWARAQGYERVTFFVENQNTKMLKLAIDSGFRITGLRIWDGRVLLEHTQDLRGD